MMLADAFDGGYPAYMCVAIHLCMHALDFACYQCMHRHENLLALNICLEGAMFSALCFTAGLSHWTGDVPAAAGPYAG